MRSFPACHKPMLECRGLKLLAVVVLLNER
jgi:hypothetical protein